MIQNNEESFFVRQQQALTKIRQMKSTAFLLENEIQQLSQS